MLPIAVLGFLSILFLLFGLYRSKGSLTEKEFFLMGRSGSAQQYHDTTVAYSLQVAVTIYFFYWGYVYGLANIVFILTWFLGLYLFALFAPKIASKIERDSFDGSLFSIIASGQKTRRLFAILFSASLIGLLFTELHFTSNFIETVSRVDLAHDFNPTFFYWVSFTVLAIVTLIYSSIGGMEKIVKIDTYQLGLAYIGSALFVAGLSSSIGNQGGYFALLVVNVGLAFTYLIIAYSDKILRLFTSEEFKIGSNEAKSRFTFFSLLLSTAIIITPFLFVPFSEWMKDPDFPPGVLSMIEVNYGWAPVIGFSIINIVWQFSDYTAFHRLSLLKLDENDSVNSVRIIRNSIYSTMLNSPLTWGIGIFAGIAINASGLIDGNVTDVFSDIVSVATISANTGDLWLYFSMIGLSIFMTCVLYSTFDSGFMSISQLLVRDVFQKNDLTLRQRYGANITVTITLFVLALIIKGYEVDILIFLNATYSWALIYGGITFLKLKNIEIPNTLILVSVFLGAIVGSLSTFNPLNLPYLVALVAPSVFAILFSTLPILGFLFIKGLVASISSYIDSIRG